MKVEAVLNEKDRLLLERILLAIQELNNKMSVLDDLNTSVTALTAAVNALAALPAPTPTTGVPDAAVAAVVQTINGLTAQLQSLVTKFTPAPPAA